MTQLLTLLPNVDSNDTNLKVGKGLSAYVKVTQSIVTKEQAKPQVKNIVRTVPRKRNIEELDTAEEERWEASSVEEKPAKKSHKNKSK